METLLTILQKHQESLGERAFIGFMTGIVITLFFVIRGAVQKNKKDFDEVKKDEESKNKDWND